ncbi:MAG: TIGR02996 domain-containing protein [Planctomycetes bacterium]|nr:TIGR02996 domain-containing protein [Planctomycetota bacterium]
MSTEAALLRTIRETPEDDTVRLVYADLVEEEGDPARGEFIRVQVALANTSETDPARRPLEEREHELLAENESRWLGVPPDSDGLTRWQFVRGFVDDVFATPSFMLNEGSDLCAANPVRRWRVGSSQGDMPEDLVEAGRRGWFSRLESLDLSPWYTAIGELERFLTRADSSRLRELVLTYRPGLDYLPGILERSPFLTQLKVLRVGGGNNYDGDRLDASELIHALATTRLTELTASACQLAAEDIRNLLMSDCCQELTSLDISDNQIEPDGWDAFRDGRCRLRSLDLSGTPLGAISLEDVLRQKSLADLRVLNLNRCGSAMANIRALATSRYWTQAEELRMQNGTVPENSLEPLFKATGSPNLRVLDVGENYFRDAGVAGLCGAKWANSLTWLGLSQNYLTDESLRAIAACERFTNLRTLHLAGNNHYDQPGADPGDRITDVGLRALAESPHLANLRDLNLMGIEFNAHTRAALHERFGPRLRIEE